MSELRASRPELRIIQQLGGGSFKSQMKKADRSGAKLALVLGENEVAANRVVVKELQHDGEQRQMEQEQLLAHLQERFK